MALTTAAQFVWAVPGMNSIIDTIDNATGLTTVYGRNEADVLGREPGAVRMTWDAWLEAATARQKAVVLRWLPVSESEYQKALNVLFPAYWSDGCFLIGEPTDHEFGTGQARFACYVRRAAGYFVSSRPLTLAEAKSL